MTQKRKDHIWNPAAEKMARPQLEALQLQRFREIMGHAALHVPFYRKLFSRERISPDNIKSLSDIQGIPFTTKQDLQGGYPYGFFAVPLTEVVRLHSSSGTTGKPTVVGYTRKDLDVWSELIARLLYAGGVSQEDIIQISFGYGMFTGGFGLHYGAEKIGATVVPVSSGNTGRQIMIMKDFGTTALVCTPSYSLFLAESIQEAGISKDDLKLRFGLFGGEPWTESMRRQIENRLGIRATDNYGLSEVMGPGVSYECLEQKGMHLAEDHFLFEIINPDTGEVLPPGESGELVITTLTKEAVPVIRYRTRDITRIISEPCACGRTSRRMSKPSGRTDDMLIIRGVNVFPSQIETVLMQMEETDPHYQLVITREGALDELEVHVEIKDAFFSDEMRVMNELAAKIAHNMKNALGLSAKIKLVEPKSLQRTEGKATHVLDMRKHLRNR
jgi:phenylacetate-CoA ligase